MTAAPTPRRTTVFLASTGHELGHYGLEEFLRTRSRLVRGADAWIHLGANFGAAIGGDPLLQASASGLRDRALEALRRTGEAQTRQRPIEEPPAGEARHIHARGGAYLSVVGANGLFHHPWDRWPDAVAVDRIVRYARAFTDVALQLANG
jgi:hypothetical protein